MKLFLSFEQEAIVADGPDAPPGARQNALKTGYVTVADAELYDGPGASQPPGNVLAYIGPLPDEIADNAVTQVAGLLKKLGHETLVCGTDF